MTTTSTAQNPDDYVVNPYTKRLIKRHSKTYERLLSARLLDEEPCTPKQNMIIQTNSSAEAKDIQSKLNKNLQKNKVITRRGNTVLKASRRPTRTEIIDKVSNIATDSIREHREHILESDMTDSEMDIYIKKLIQQKLISNQTPKVREKSKTNANTPKVISTKSNLDSYDDVDDENDDETCDY